ncbi:hypothetical protein D2A34_05230 [Clostridium chromiireducens]|uniref:DUF5659 domain-containing protein n=1 Tax=Clostridium chromiireducens TaxID=225345 RepID=A0A399J1G6_9CLOT|nr:hypothetical protein [Clostridium chromiireducens]RII36786.1 hypothetical protein D2A34_05230 [Clostridium chromiireducens]
MQTRVQRVFNNHIAGQLLMEGFVLIDTHPNKNNPKVKVFRFENGGDLQKRLKELKKQYSTYVS